MPQVVAKHNCWQPFFAEQIKMKRRQRRDFACEWIRKNEFMMRYVGTTKYFSFAWFTTFVLLPFSVSSVHLIIDSHEMGGFFFLDAFVMPLKWKIERKRRNFANHFRYTLFIYKEKHFCVECEMN